MTLRHCKRVHIVVLVVPKRGGGFYTHLLATHPMILRQGNSGPRIGISQVVPFSVRLLRQVLVTGSGAMQRKQSNKANDTRPRLSADNGSAALGTGHSGSSRLPIQDPALHPCTSILGTHQGYIHSCSTLCHTHFSGTFRELPHSENGLATTYNSHPDSKAYH